MVAAGRLRVNSQPIAKPHYHVRPGDVARRICGQNLQLDGGTYPGVF